METLTIPTDDEFSIVADVYAAAPARVVVMCHGFKGHRRWGFIPGVAECLESAGMTAVAMDFSLNGRIAPGSTHPADGFPAPEAFRRNTVARERGDLARVLGWVRGGGDGRFAPGTTPGLWGHSRGGVAAMLVALDDDAVPALVTWSTAAHPDFYTAAQKSRWREAGAMGFTDHESQTPLAIDVGYLDDLERHHDTYALARRAGALRSPHLIVHGEQDMVIPVTDAVRLYNPAGEARPGGGAAPPPRARNRGGAADKELLRLTTGHTFGYEGGSEALDRATRATVEWFDRHLPARESS